MVLPVDAQAFKTSASRLKGFFNELRENFIEREQILLQFALALLSREHVLMTGPPGTAKSQLASAVLRRIIDENTGEPSVFARQFTENTVQTDLIGPIDFKTLMETGRTEHFTDEGMLGAVHAFLDEVFDGRDMLLRSTLNLLLEREVKQGGRTTRGRIECAFMTSNRYIAEILETSRETLLAFIDRVAFISFVPRSFADRNNLANVVRRQAGGRGQPALTSFLTVQDLDVLQATAEAVFVPDGICDAIASLVDMLDAELAKTVKSDPNFSPTRYLSTRTAVRSARILRAVVVYDKIFNRADRPLEAIFDDIKALRVQLLLAGPDPESVANLLTRETDPRERRQLEILRTESEIFNRCLSRLVAVPPRPRPEVDIAKLRALADTAIAAPGAVRLVEATRTIAKAATSAGSGAEKAADLLVDTVSVLLERALRAGLSSATPAEKTLGSITNDLASLADDLENAAPSTRPMARWLRGRVLHLMDEAAQLAPIPGADTVEILTKDGAAASAIIERAERRLSAAESLVSIRRRLEASGADMPDRARSETALTIALGRLEDELALLWDAILRSTARNWLGGPSDGSAAAVLGRLEPEISQIEDVDRRMQAIGRESTLKERVIGPRLAPLFDALFRGNGWRERRVIVKEVEALLVELGRVDLRDVIDPATLLRSATAAIAESQRVRSSADDLASGPSSAAASPSTYNALVTGEDGMSLTETLVEIAIQVGHDARRENRMPKETVEGVLEHLRALPADLRAEIVRLDVVRIGRRVGFLEGWWKSSASSVQTSPSLGSMERIALLEKIVQSGFMRVFRGHALGLALEARQIADVFPEDSKGAEELRSRIEALDRESTSVLLGLLQTHADRAWQLALTSKSRS